MRLNKIFLTGLFAALPSFSAYCQTLPGPATGIKAIIAAIDTFNTRLPEEKLFLHLDKPYYTPGDTIWYKAYLLNSSLSSSPLSGLLYVELINDSSKVIKRQMLPVTYGVSWGDIVLKPGLYAGSYTIRAYTNWMRNFGEDRFFSRQLYIGPSGKDSWLVNTEVTTTKDLLRVDLQFRDFARKAIDSQEMRLRISDEKNTFNREQVITDSEGKLAISLALPEKANRKELTILAEDVRQVKGEDHHKVLIPVQLNRPEYTDLQFMPEGGALLTRLPVRVGFKAIGEDGKGVAISGKVYAQHPADSGSSSEAVASFASLFKGMGSFELTPKAGERYTAKVTMPGGTEKSYPLPEVKSSGVALQIQNLPGSDSLTLAIQTTADMANTGGTYFLVGMACGKVCYGANVSFLGKTIRRKIAKKLFPTGIVKFTLFAEGNRPLTERLIFIDHQDQLRIGLTANRESTPASDSIALNILVRDEAGNPLEGSFSLAVTDDSQVKADSPQADNILSYMLLSADLKGVIEDPGYYLQQDSPEKAEHLDNLLLTQGWTNYPQDMPGTSRGRNIREIGDWERVFHPPGVPEYTAEVQFKVTGRVHNVLNGTLSNVQVSLVSLRKPPFLLDAFTDKQGRFEFSDLPKLDTISFRIQGRNKNNKSFNVLTEVDEFRPPGFTLPEMSLVPWNINSDTAMIRYIDKSAEQREEIEQMAKLSQGSILKDVVIRGQRPEDGGKLAYSLDEEEIRNARPNEKPLNLMQLYFRTRKIFWKERITVDGIGAPRNWLDIHTSDDIISMTVRIVPPPPPNIGAVWPTAEIRIISKSGKGPTLGKVGAYYYRPMPMSWPHQFYSPRYTAKNEDSSKDLRSTIYWKPDIVTDTSGKALASFFTGNPASCTVIIQGTDLNGKVGYLQQKMVLTKSSVVLSK